jgi:hypothetical protein
MQNTTKSWQDLCAQAAEEQNSDHLLELLREINRMLYEKEVKSSTSSANRDLDNEKASS